MNNFIFPHQGDPLVTDSALKELDAYRELLIAEKSKMTPQKQPANNPWDTTETELNSLTEEQRAMLMSDEEFIGINNKVQEYLQVLLNTLLKPEMLKQQDGLTLLQERLDVVKSLKKKVVKESTKQMELFKEFTAGHSDKTWEEFLKLKGKS